MSGRAQYTIPRAETTVLLDLLTSVSAEPAALIIEGAPGIGKTTLWLAGIDHALHRGFQVLTAHASSAESVMAYAALADLLSVVEPATLTALPGSQRLALDRVLLRHSDDQTSTDQRVVGAAFLSVIASLAAQSNVLIAIDDLQWLDAASARVIAFAARRLPAGAGMIVTVRTDSLNDPPAVDWLELPRPSAISRIGLDPLKLGHLHQILSERLGHSFPRPALVRIHEISGGNPLYAIELARAWSGSSGGQDLMLPPALAELLRDRISALDIHDVLLAAACMAKPTVEVIAAAAGVETNDVPELLAGAEEQGIIEIAGHSVRFTHPMLATSVYGSVTPDKRRAIHRRLAAVVDQAELCARHLALAATTGDQETVQALDSAAIIARHRGAPAAAAELIDLALKLGADTPIRRIWAARNDFDAGDSSRARARLDDVINELPPGLMRAATLNLLAGIRMHDDSFMEAAELLVRALGEITENPALRSRTLLALSLALVFAGQFDAALQRAREAVETAEEARDSQALSQALGMRVTLGCMHGDGVDEVSAQRSLELDDPTADTPAPLRPAANHAMVLAWQGRLGHAHSEMMAIRRRCIEAGAESDLMFIGFHTVLIEIWRGNLAGAAEVADDTVERALQLGSDHARAVALGVRAAVGAYAGREVETRADAQEALAAARRCGSSRLMEWPTMALGHLEASLGNHDTALAILEPLLADVGVAPGGTEIIVASFIPDAVDAMISLGRLADAEPLTTLLERNGQRLDRPWMLAVGARCRGMLLAADGDLDGAVLAMQRAMAEHVRLPMPFERARSQLVLGQLQRRQRRKGVAAVSLGEALRVFEDLGTELWAVRARAELERTSVGKTHTGELSPSERRVAELAGSGMTNRDVAAALFISAKTVEANLSRIYRKLDIRSRAELGQRMWQPDR
jgi:DNA-binding CsgD family transcriptional regulator/tetratricopeptide (TPR) repeat protein